MQFEKISTFYDRLEAVVNQLTEDQLNTPVKSGGWTPKQLIHHLADAQTQAFYRILWLLSEKHSILKTFDQDAWVEILGDQPIDGAMVLLKGIYSRWSALLETLNEADIDKAGFHPDMGPVTVGQLIDAYIDHGESHVSQFAKMVA